MLYHTTGKKTNEAMMFFRHKAMNILMSRIQPEVYKHLLRCYFGKRRSRLYTLLEPEITNTLCFVFTHASNLSHYTISPLRSTIAFNQGHEYDDGDMVKQSLKGSKGGARGQ